MSPYGCYCQATGALCNDCLSEHHSWYAGIAYNRGVDWARAVANVVPIDRPWPMTPKMRAVALRKAARLARDARLLEMLADEVVKGARRWWDAAYEAARDAG